jgi:hypothetical protein
MTVTAPAITERASKTDVITLNVKISDQSSLSDQRTHAVSLNRTKECKDRSMTLEVKAKSSIILSGLAKQERV